MKTKQLNHSCYVRMRSSVCIERNGNILLIYDPVYRGGCWIFPGGGIEFHETIKEAGEREVFEETGLVVNVHSFWKIRIIKELDPDFLLVKNSDNEVFRKTIEFILVAEYLSGEIDITRDPSIKEDGKKRVKYAKWFPKSVLKIGKINNKPLYPKEVGKHLHAINSQSTPISELIFSNIDLISKR